MLQEEEVDPTPVVEAVVVTNGSSPMFVAEPLYAADDVFLPPAPAPSSAPAPAPLEPLPPHPHKLAHTSNYQTMLQLDPLLIFCPNIV